MDQKYRHELKYLVSQAQLSLLKARIAPFMQQDPHAPGGSYNISSLYFDDYCNTSYFTCSGTTGGGGSIFKVSW